MGRMHAQAKEIGAIVPLPAPGLGLAMGVALLALVLGCRGAEESPLLDEPGVPSATTAFSEDVAPPRLELAAHGRARIDRARVRAAAEVELELEILDDGPPDLLSRSVRLVSVSGRRLDLEARAAPDRPTRFLARVPSAFLEPELYLIEVDAHDEHPVDLRRFVLDVRP